MQVQPEPHPEIDVPGMHIWGWMTPTELEWLMAQAATMESVVEVGSLHGRSAFALLTACPGPVYCIDPWDDEYDKCYPSFMGACGAFGNLRAVRGYSPNPDVMGQIPAKVEMVFIDADHEYESVKADIEAFLPRTTKLICGHDYQNANGGYPGVAKAVHEIFGVGVENPEGTAIWAVEIAPKRKWRRSNVGA